MISTICRKVESLYHRYDRIRKIAWITGQNQYAVMKNVNDFAQDNAFFAYILKKMVTHLQFTPSRADFDFTRSGGSVFFPCVTLHALIALLKPAVVVETGGTPGKSSAGILKAMEENNRGHLFTLDLPPQETTHKFGASLLHQMRPADDISCWAIEPSLRARHTLILGDAKKTLPELLTELKQVDIFIHDSDHSYEHMMFEFQTAWPFIKRGGLLMSDDIPTNESFYDFARQVGREPIVIGNYGILVK